MQATNRMHGRLCISGRTIAAQERRLFDITKATAFVSFELRPSHPGNGAPGKSAKPRGCVPHNVHQTSQRCAIAALLKPPTWRCPRHLEHVTVTVTGVTSRQGASATHSHVNMLAATFPPKEKNSWLGPWKKRDTSQLDPPKPSTHSPL